MKPVMHVQFYQNAKFNNKWTSPKGCQLNQLKKSRLIKCEGKINNYYSITIFILLFVNYFDD